MLSVAGPALSLVLALADSGSTPDLELCIQKFQSAFGAWLITLLVNVWQPGNGDTALSHHSGLIPQPDPTLQHSPARNPGIPKHQAKAGFVLLVGASYHKLLNFTPCFWSAVLLSKLCRSCCVSDMHFAKQRNFHLVQ